MLWFWKTERSRLRLQRRFNVAKRFGQVQGSEEVDEKRGVFSEGRVDVVGRWRR